MTEIEAKTLDILSRGPATCATIGEQLWGTAWSSPQSYCRPAGKVLRRLAGRGLVRRIADPHRVLWEKVDRGSER